MDYDDIIIAIEPYYCKDRGDCSRVYFESRLEPSIFPQKPKSILRSLCRQSGVDILLQKRRLRDYLHCKNLFPVYFDERVFFPYKFRSPFVRNDGAFGYISLDHTLSIKDFSSKDRSSEKKGDLVLSRLTLSNGLVLDGIAKAESANIHFRNAKIVRDLNKRNVLLFMEKEGLYEISGKR